jgi:lysophospholipid acyltransferase (LPLAT)-like uncharacterized protein
VLPVYAAVRRAWRLDSWDQFCIPKPFARVRVAYGAPITINPGAGNLEQAEALAPRAMDEVERMAQWPDGAAIPTG